MWRRSSAKAMIAALALVLTWGSTATAQEREATEAPPRAGSIRWELVGTGLGVFGVSYATAMVFAVLPQDCVFTSFGGSPPPPPPDCYDRRSPRLFIPLVGPFTQFGDGQSGFLHAIYAIDGSLQIAGVALAVAGLVWRKPPATEALRWTPFVGHRTIGLSGTF